MLPNTANAKPPFKYLQNRVKKKPNTLPPQKKTKKQTPEQKKKHQKTPNHHTHQNKQKL